MANHKSAMKRSRQNDKRRERNVAVRSTAKTDVKKALDAINTATSRDAALKALALGERSLQKAASKGVLPRERASRKTSRLAAAVTKKFPQTASARK